MAVSERIGVIGANGWLGSALVRSVLNSKLLGPERLILSCRSGNRGLLSDVAVHWTTSNAELAACCDVVVISVRPRQFSAIQVDLRGKLAVSVMAGVSSERIYHHTGAQRIVRAMPNAAAAISKSFTPWFATAEVRPDEKANVQAFFAASGEAVEVPDEALIDYCTGLTGSGAAFPAMLAAAMIAEAVARGVPEWLAERAVRGVICDASQLLRAANCQPRQIVDEMVAYRGTTAAALQAMRDQGFMEAVAEGLRAAADKIAALDEVDDN